MNDKRKQTMSREEARALYDNLRNSMEKKLGKLPVDEVPTGKGAKAANQNTARELAEIIGAASDPSKKKTRIDSKSVGSKAYGISPAAPKEFPTPSASSIQESMLASMRSSQGRQIPGYRRIMYTFGFVVTAGLMNATFSTLDAVGVLRPDSALVTAPVLQNRPTSPYDRAEREILLNLDARRATLEEQRKKLDDRESDLQRKERELVARVTEIRELTRGVEERRDERDRKQTQQVEQLARVYSNMSPEEAASLIGQLEITIAHELLSKMSEKRVGQILSLMEREKALLLTRMMTGQ